MKYSNAANAAMATFALANLTAFAAGTAHAQQATPTSQQANNAPRQAKTAPRQANTPPRQANTPARQANTPARHTSAPAQRNTAPAKVPQITIAAPAEQGGYAADAQYHTDNADLGPLGNQSILNTPVSVSVVPEDLMVNQQAQTVNDALRYLPSVEIRDQQGYEVSRPQSLGFMGGIAGNTRLDGLNVIGTTAIPTENLSGIQVLNGLGGALYGPETAAGVFNYVLKRPTDTPTQRFIEGFDSSGVLTEEADIGGRTGPDNKVGYRFDFVHGEGGSYAPDSNVNRTLFSADLDWHLDDQTVVETDFSHYETNITGLPGSIVYDGNSKSTILPKAVDPTKLGYGQPGAGADLITDTGLVKIKHSFNDDWSMEVGGLYQNAIRNLYGITNTMTNNAGDYTVTKNFAAVPHFTIGSNTASLNGHFDTFGMKNDFSIGTNGYVNQQYNYRDSIAVTLGTSSLANPAVLPTKPTPNNGGEYQAAYLEQQSFILGDTLHFTDKWAVQAVLSSSFMDSKSYSTADKVTGSTSSDGTLSPTVSLIYKPVRKLTTYLTYASSVEPGDQAPAGTANAYEFMAPYHDVEYQGGVKYAVTDALLVSLDAFHMTRPLATTSATTNIFSVVGTQRNIGVELFAQGNVTPDLSILGGITYIDAKLIGSGDAATNNKWVVGVPDVKSDVALDYHPAFANGFALTTAAHFEGARAATDTNNSFAPSYATLDIGVRYSTPFMGHHVTARFQVINVTNVFYYSSIADGNIVGSPGANTAYLGAPRTFEATLEFDF
jgi:iron complex outermembrane receptor protein